MRVKSEVNMRALSKDFSAHAPFPIVPEAEEMLS